MKMKSRLSFSNSPLMAAKKTCLSLLSALLVLSLFSCDPDDENDGRHDKSSMSLQSLRVSVSTENQNTSTRSNTASADDESFTFTIGENNDCEITCVVTDMEDNAPAIPTRGTPVGSTVPYVLDGTTTVISSVTNSIESIYGSDGIAITAYQKDKDNNISLLEPNSETKDKDTENANSVLYFQNLKYTYSATAFEGVGSWITAAAIPGYYWHKDDKLCFYTVAPATLTPNYNAADGTASFSYTVPTDNANQKDVLIGATGFLTRPTIIEDEDTKYNMEVDLPTYHALCAVRFVIDNRELGTAPNYTQRPKEFKLTSIKLTNLKTGGTCTYTYNSSSSATSADCVTWNLTSSSTGDYSCTFGTSSGVAIAKTNTTYNLHSADGSASGSQLTNVFLLVPQDLVEDCKVTINYTYDAYEYNTSGVQTIVPEACTISGQLVGSGATKDSGGAYTSYGSWEPGKMYTYVIPSKYIKRKGVLYTIDGTINYNSGTKGSPDSDDSWWSITDFASTTGLTLARGHNSPGDFSIDVSDIKYIEFSWTDQTKKFVTNTASYVTAAHIWLEGDLLAGGYYRNGLTGTSGHNGTGLDHNYNPDKTVENYSYKDPVTGTIIGPKDYTDVYMYEKLIKASPSSYSDGVNYSHKWVFDVSAYSTIKIPAYFYNAQTGGGSCLWDLTNFKVTALEFMDW